VGAGDVFGLGARESDSRLLLEAPADGAASQGEDITRCQLAVINVAGPVGVSITEECGDTGGIAAQNQLVVGGFLQVAKNAVEGMLVVRARVCGVVAKCCNGVSEIQLCCQHRIHERAEGLLVHLGVDSRGSEFEEMFLC